MPIYEYECPQCGVIEVVQKVSEKALTQCPNCKEKGEKRKVTKLLSRSAFHLKGSGWYKTDYQSGSSSSSSSSGTVEKSKSEKDSKPADGAAAKETKESKKSLKAAGCGGGCSCH